jgi:hypothetical protein
MVLTPAALLVQTAGQYKQMRRRRPDMTAIDWDDHRVFAAR